MATHEDTWTMGALASFVLLIAVLVAAIAVWVWMDDDDKGASLGRVLTVEGIPTADAFDGDGFADELVGRQVTVSGNVDEMVGDNAIRLGGEDFGGDGVLVVDVDQPDVGDRDDITVVGTVHDFDAAALARRFGTDVFEDDVYQPWMDENILVASNLTALDNESWP